jgi:hypothetical protein
VSLEAEIIVLCSTRNVAVERMQREMLDSFLATTPDRCQIRFGENSSAPEEHLGWKRHVEANGQRFVFSEWGFAMNRIDGLVVAASFSKAPPGPANHLIGGDVPERRGGLQGQGRRREHAPEVGPR